MKIFHFFPTEMILAVIIIGMFYFNKQEPESVPKTLSDVGTTSNQTNTIPVEVRIVTVSRDGSIIQATGMSESQAKEFGKDNGIPFDDHSQPVSQYGNTYMLFPDQINSGDSIWFADNHANKAIN